MEFKGTKGPWYVGEGEMQDTGLKELVIAPLKPINHKGGYRLICCISPITDCDSEDVANARLISKAPEMLDFINRLSGEMLRNDFVLDEKWYDQAKQLIKSANQI